MDTLLKTTVNDALFSAALSGAPMESTLVTVSGAVFAVRLVNLPVPCSGLVELLWRCRYIVSSEHLLPYPETYPESIGEAVIWSAKIKDAVKDGEFIEPFKEITELIDAWDEQARESLTSLLNKPDQGHINILRRLSVKPFPRGWQIDPLHVYRLLLLKASSAPEDPPGIERFGDLDLFMESTSRHPEARRPTASEIANIRSEFNKDQEAGGPIL